MKALRLIFLTFLFMQALSAQASGTNYSIKILATELPPYTFTENEKPKGIILSPIMESAERNNTYIEVEFMPWQRVLKELENNPGTFIVAMARSPEREKLYHWVAPARKTRIGFISYMNEHRHAEGDEDHLFNDRICVEAKTPMDNWISKRPYKNVVMTTSSFSCMKALQTGRVDYWLTDETLAHYTMQHHKGQPEHLIFHHKIMEPVLYISTSLKTSQDVVEHMRVLLSTSDLDAPE